MSTRPNILLFMTDQQQAQVVRPDHPCRTPNVQALAASGLRFDAAYTVTAHCCPSRATFMTGLFPSRHGVYNNVSTDTAIHSGLRTGVVTFAEQLKAAGYHLAYSGKWHVSNEENPADRGWEELLVTSKATGQRRPGFAEWENPNRPIDRNEPRGRGEIVRPGYTRLKLYGSYPDRGPKGYDGTGDDRIVQAAIEALPRLTARQEPWFLFVGPHGPHDPFIIPEKYARLYDPDEVPLPPSFADSLADKPRIYQRQRRDRWGQLSEAEVREAIAHYWGYCTMMDDLFGEVLAALDATGATENTLVIFLSDHGDYCGAHGLFMKGVAAFDEAYRVPAVLRWPAGIASPGRVVNEFITLADFAPTFMELAECIQQGQLSGRSLVPFLGGQTPGDWPDARFTQFNGVELYYSQRVVSTRRYKYVFNGFDFDELYDLERDPFEMTNLSDDPAYADVKRDLVRRLWQKAREEEDFIFNGYGTVALLPYGPRAFDEEQG